MQSIAKANALVRELADKLAKRFAGSATIDTVRQTSDSAGWPMLICSDGGNEAAGQAVIAIRIKNVDMVSKDVFGGSTFAYAPHILDIAWELAAANNPIPTDADIFIATVESAKTGVRLQAKELANGTAVTAANMDAATPAADVDDLYWPTKAV